MIEPDPGDLVLRRPLEEDHARIVAVMDAWWQDRRARNLLPRLWLRHFAGRSWVAETGERQLAGFLVGFLSDDRPDEAVIQVIGVDPNRRRRGIGRQLVDRFTRDAADAGRRVASAVAWPGDRGAVAFLQALGFAPSGGPSSQRLYGTPSFADYDAEGEDRTLLIKSI